MKILKEITSKPLYKAVSLNSISVLVKVIAGFIISKFIAIFVGPTGLALVGNLRNFMSSIEAIGTLGFENGVVKYVSEHKDEDERLKKTLSTVFITVAISCGLLSLLLFLFSEKINHSLFGDYHYAYVFKVIAIAMPLYIGNLFIIATINGLGKFKKVIYINIIGSIIGLLISVFLLWKFNTEGALLGLIATPTLLFFVSFFFVNQEIEILRSIRLKSYHFSTLKDLSSFSLMALASSVIGPMVFVAIRNNIITTVGIEQAGYWEAMTRISTYYLLFISTMITVYFLPKMSAAKDNQETKKIFFEYYKGIMPIFILGLIIIYLLRQFIIHILFTKEFLHVSNLFFWQLIGDSLKATTLILGFQFYAKKLTFAFIIFELFSLTVLYFSTIFLVSIYKIEGVVMAHAFTYLIYLISLSLYFRKSLFS